MWLLECGSPVQGIYQCISGINSVQIWEELSVNSRNVQYWPVSTSFPHLNTPSKQWLTWNLMVRISQNTLQQLPALYYWIQLITYHFLKVNFEQVLDALLNSSGVWLKPPYSLFLSAVNSFRFLRILFLVGLAALLSLRKTRWKAHSGQASKGTFPQLQSKFTTTYFSDCRISFLFRIDCYDSRYLAENTPWGLNIFYWRHSLRIRAYFTQWRRAQDLFTLPESREYYTYRFYSVFK